jgi:hypothetical protein
LSSVTNFAGATQVWAGGIVANTANWTNPNNALAGPDSSYATVGIGGSGGSGGPGSNYADSIYLSFGVFGFSIPAGATINGVAVNLYMNSTEPSTCTITLVQLTSSTTSTTGSNLASSNTIGSSNTLYTFGGSTNTWGATLSASVINNSGFGFLLSVNCSDTTTSQTVSVDYGNVAIYYSGGVSIVSNGVPLFMTL